MRLPGVCAGRACILHVFEFLDLLLGLFWLGSRENSLNTSRFDNFFSFDLTMLYAFDLNLKWLSDTLVKEVNEKVEMLVRQDEASIFAYQRIVLSLAAGDLNPGRLLMIQFFSDSVKEHLVKKICGMSQSEYRSQGWLRWLRTLFTEQSIAYRRLIREIDHINGVCLTFAHLRLQAGERVMVEKEFL